MDSPNTLNMKTEIWKDISGYEGLYQVSNLGRIKHLPRYVYNYKGDLCYYKEKILNPFKTSNHPYLCVILLANSKRKTYQVHTIVAQAFIPYTGYNPDGSPIKGQPQINHKNENPEDNDIDNLEWCDSKYNCNYGNWKNKHSRKILCIDTNTIYNSLKDAADDIKISPTHLRRLIKKQKKCKGYLWKYV